MKTITLNAPAKTNLWLRILGRRPDGFHEIETRMVLLDLCDQIRIEAGGRHSGSGSDDLQFSCSDESLPRDGSNLVVRAVELMRAETGELPPLSVHLEKRIPHGAGLGGGSSDAAAVLRGLNDLLELGLSLDCLSAMAAKIGSDVPFFLYQGPCDSSGRGEVISPADDFRVSLPLLLIKPPFPVSTPWAYQQWARSREISGVDYQEQRFPWGGIRNDLERPVFAKYLVLADLKMWLCARTDVRGALLSGSGSTVFAILSDDRASLALGEAVRAEFGGDFWIRPARTLAGGPADDAPADGQGV